MGTPGKSGARRTSSSRPSSRITKPGSGRSPPSVPVDASAAASAAACVDRVVVLLMNIRSVRLARPAPARPVETASWISARLRVSVQSSFCSLSSSSA
jgi:hypothetical protein